MTDGGPGVGRQIVTLPYLEEFPGGNRRPYLWLEFEGPSGARGPVLGLVDTGADVSVLPLGYAALMGFRAEDLDLFEIHGVGGQVDTYRPRDPIPARVGGLEDIDPSARRDNSLGPVPRLLTVWSRLAAPGGRPPAQQYHQCSRAGGRPSGIHDPGPKPATNRATSP